MPDAPLSRPSFGPGLAVAEFDAWDWRKDELIAFAKTLGVPTRGTKEALAKRIRTQLGRVYPPTATVVTESEVAMNATDGVATPATLKVVIGDTTRIPPTVSRPKSAPRATGFFKAEPGESRADALAAWFSKRNSRAS
jgi:SAP domain-containing new25